MTNINAKNIAKYFNKLSKNYDKTAFLESESLNHISRLETSFILKNLKVKPGQKILDMGVGTGRNARLILEKKAFVQGIDISQKMVDIAEKKIKIKNFSFLLHDAGKSLTFKDHTFDGVICIRVLKYIPTWKTTLNEAYRVLKNNGKFIFEIPDKYSIRIFGRYSNYFLLSKSEILKELKNIGFKIEKIEGIGRLPYILYKIKQPYVSKILKIIDFFLNKILPNTFLSRDIFFYCRK